MSGETVTRNAEIVHRYRDGASCAALADEYRVTPQRIWQILKIAGEPRRGPGQVWRRLRDQNERLRAQIAAMHAALRSVGIHISTEDEDPVWCVTLEPFGEEPVSSLDEALSRTMGAWERDGYIAGAEDTRRKLEVPA